MPQTRAGFALALLIALGLLTAFAPSPESYRTAEIRRLYVSKYATRFPAVIEATYGAYCVGREGLNNVGFTRNIAGHRHLLDADGIGSFINGGDSAHTLAVVWCGMGPLILVPTKTFLVSWRYEVLHDRILLAGPIGQ